jgi:hypothetical protein
LSEKDHWVLVRLCVIHQNEYVEGKKGDFWANIRLLLQKETGKNLKDATSSVKTRRDNLFKTSNLKHKQPELETNSEGESATEGDCNKVKAMKKTVQIRC